MADVHRVIAPVANLRDANSGKVQRQLLFGERFDIEKKDNQNAFGIRQRDGYRGVIRLAQLGDDQPRTHFVNTTSAQIYAKPDIKSDVVHTIPMQALINAPDTFDRFYKTSDGYIPTTNVLPITQTQPDLVKTAMRFVDAPYLWGGNSIWGIDCSGLIAACCFAAGIDCPADSGDQARLMGDDIPKGGILQAGDLIFWPGHVAMMVDRRDLIHANAHHMRVTVEPLADVAARIMAQEGHPILRRARPRPA